MIYISHTLIRTLSTSISQAKPQAHSKLAITVHNTNQTPSYIHHGFSDHSLPWYSLPMIQPLLSSIPLFKRVLGRRLGTPRGMLKGGGGSTRKYPCPSTESKVGRCEKTRKQFLLLLGFGFGDE